MLNQSAKSSTVRGTVEQAMKVNIQTIYAAVSKSGDPICSMAWTCGGQTLGTGAAILLGDKLIVVVGERSYSAAITYVEPHLGGVSRLLKCPLACARNVVTLFVSNAGMSCRSCSHLTYQSQREHAPDRARRKAFKISLRLDPGHVSLTSIPGRRKGQWRRSYLRLLSNLARLHDTTHSVYQAELEHTKHKKGDGI